MPKLSLTIGLAAGSLLAAAGVAHAAGAQLLAHRAVYDLSLAKSGEGSSAPVSARGRIVYEFTGSACEGWVTNFRQITELQMNEGEARLSDMRSSTFEEADGSGFNFKTDTLVNGKVVESIDGHATRAADGGLAISLSKPKPSKTDLEPGPIFPTAQILKIVDLARAGDRTAEIKIFDGSDSGQKAFDTMTIIGRARSAAPTDEAAAAAESLKGVQRWPVSVSYFDPNKRDGAPNYILGFDLYENGVSGALRIDYGSYVLSGAMAKFETLPQKECAK